MVVPGMDTLDLGPSAASVSRLVAGIADDQLGAPTPCADYAVGDLVEHVGGLARGFLLSARKQQMDPAELRDGDAAHLEPGWRGRIVDDLATLAEAWTEASAWEGTTWAGPVELPASEAGHVALDELVVHGWDLARATAQAYDPDPVAVAACLRWLAGFDGPTTDDGGLFGPPVEVAASSSDLDRLVGLTGRDPAWSPR